VSEATLLNGANHFAYGARGRWEIIVAQDCVLNGDGTYTLTNILRGRFGTQEECRKHIAGDVIVYPSEAGHRIARASPF